MMKRTVTAAISAALILTGCSTATTGEPASAPKTSTSTVSTTTTTTTVARQLPGLRTDAPAPTITITITPASDSAVDIVIEQAVSDASGYWSGAAIEFFPPEGLQPYPAAPASGDKCLVKLDVIRACGYEIVWEKPEIEGLYDVSGELGTMVMFAHEVGHFVQNAQPDRAANLSERGADCLAGVYAQSIIDDRSQRFTGSYTDITTAARFAFAYNDDPATVDDRLDALRKGIAHDADFCLSKYP